MSSDSNVTQTLQQISQTLIQCFARSAEISPAGIDEKKSLASYGLDSITAHELIAEVRERFNVELTLSVLNDYPSIHAIAEFIVGKMPQARTI